MAGTARGSPPAPARLIERYGGREIKTLGDGFLITFDRPARAVECALGLADEARATALEIRCGIHAGECEVMEDDIGGMAVHLASRVSAVAGPSEVLVTSTVRDLVIGSALTFSPRGEHTLKGVPGAWTLYAAGGAPRGDAPVALLPTNTRAPTLAGRTMDLMALRTHRLARVGGRLSRQAAKARH